MISESQAKKYCRDDISKIKGYAEAVADKKHLWICHHINGEPFTGFSRNDLEKMNMLYNRPASELKFVTSKMHNNLHDAGSTTRFGASKGHSNKGKHLSDATKAKMSAAQKGRVGYTKGYKWKLVNGKRVYFKEEACHM